MRNMLAVLVLVCVACGGLGVDELNSAGGRDSAETSYYVDVAGLNVTSKLEIGKWPSQLDDTKLVGACAKGEAFYADRCWASVAIDLDERSVTFSADSGDVAVIALGAPPPSVLGPLVLQSAANGTKFYGQHHEGIGYVAQTACQDGQSSYSFELWNLVAPVAAFTTRSPWATGFCFEVEDGKLSAFAARATFLYGFARSGNDVRLAHNWSYRGYIKVAGRKLQFPVRFADITAATGTEPNPVTLGTPYDMNLAGNTVRVHCDHNVLAARRQWHGDAEGLAADDLVTDVQFAVRAIPR